MIIAQITDIHLGFDQGNPDEINRQRLDRTLATLAEASCAPEIILATGDLTEHGDRRSYEALRDAFAQLPVPIWPILGNHDQRANFLTVFPDVPTVDGFVQYAVELDGLRLLMLDTLEEGRHGGGFCEIRAAWLAGALAARPSVPTIIVMHHPPVPVGIAWMDPRADEDWILRFKAAIAGHRQIRAIFCGHLHRPVVAPVEGVTLFVCPATAVQLGFDLRPIDPDAPDGRAMITLDPSVYGVHRWSGGQLASHYVTVSDERVLVRYDEKMQRTVREMLAEKR
jgi:3',5'-cyclic AMP phosphodiesterase CpdA